MATLGVYTDVYRAKLAALGANAVGALNVDAPRMRVSYFKVGEGGQVAGVPVAPDPARTDIEAQGVGTNGLYFFPKSFGLGDISGIAGVLQLICQVLASEGNGPGGTGGDPVFYELGIFDEDGDMMAYLTFDGRVKNSLVPFVSAVTVKYARL